MRSPAVRTSCFAVAALLLSLVALTGLVVAQESAGYSMDRVTVTAGGQPTTSTSYDSTIVVQWGAPSGAASFCNTGFVTSLGFFSFFGDLTVPTRLRLEKTAIDPTAARLSWTGSADLFRVYRSSSPQDLIDPANLERETLLCESSDSSDSDDLVFYRVTPAD